MEKQTFFLLVFCIFTIKSCYCEDVSLQMFLRKPINIVNDNFISFSIDPLEFLEFSKEPSVNVSIISQLSPAFLKISGISTNQLILETNHEAENPDKIQITPEKWKKLDKWLNDVNMQPIIALPYNPKTWKPREVIKILKMANDIGLKNCIWQLGSDLNNDTITYVDHLGTLRNIVEAFEMEGNNWSVLGADLSAANHPDDARLYADISEHIVEANGWLQSHAHSSLERDDNLLMYKEPILRNLLRRRNDIWLTIPSHTTNLKTCNRQCLSDGLYWTETLGMGAQTGFSVLFRTINRYDLLYPSLSYYVTAIHKKLMGGEVFDTRIVKGDRLATQFYAQCTKDVSGSFTVMGVNFVNYKVRALAKMQNLYPGDKVHQYILTVDNGQILLNGNSFTANSTFEPTIKTKSTNRPIYFSLPPYSVGFWSFPQANLKECLGFKEMDDLIVEETNLVATRPKTASEKLLQELVIESINSEKSDSEKLESRQKRHLVVKKDSSFTNRRRRRSLSPENFNKKLTDDAFYRNMILSVSKNYLDRIQQRNKRLVMEVLSNPIFTNLKQMDDNAALKRLYLPFRINKRAAMLNNLKRSKRQVNNSLNRLFGFELPKPINLNMPPIFNLGPSAIQPVSSVHDVYKVNSRENIFKSLENTELPEGDVYFEVEQNSDYKDDKQKLGIPEDVKLRNAPGKYIEHYTDMTGRKFTNMDIPTYGELWEADVYQKAAPPLPANVKNDQLLPKGGNVKNIEFVVQELQPTISKNKENMAKARNNLQSYYFNNKDQLSPTNSKKSKNDFDSEEDSFYKLSRHRRSNDFNDNFSFTMDESSKNNAGAEILDFDRSDNQLGKTTILQKIANLLNLLENLEENGEELKTDIFDDKENGNRKSSKRKFFKQQENEQKIRRDLRKKCKILALNLEEQCLSDSNIFSRTFNKREVKYMDKMKNKKGILSKKGLFRSKDGGRNIRSIDWQTESWEDNNNINRIQKNFLANTVPDSDLYVPFVANNLIHMEKPEKENSENSESNEYDEEEDFHHFNQISESIENHQKIEQISTNLVPKKIAESPFIEKIPLKKENKNSTESPVSGSSSTTTTTTTTTESNGYSDDNVTEITSQDYIEVSERYDSPKIVKTITKGIVSLLDIVNKHVSGWWNAI